VVFDSKKFIQNLIIAFSGIKIALKEQTFRIFLILIILALILSLIFKISFFEKLILILVICLVLALELINSQVEKILDFLQPNHDSRVKKIKDLSAAAVLISCLGAGAIGILIFLPHFIRILF